MESFTIELVSNASFDCYPNNTLSSFTNFLPERIDLKGEWEVAITEISYPSMYQNITDGRFFYGDSMFPIPNRAGQFQLKPGLYESITQVVHEMSKLIFEDAKMFNHYISLEIDRMTQQISLKLPSETASLAIMSADLSHILGVERPSERVGVVMRGEGPHTPQYPYDIVRIHSLMIYTDVIQYNIVGDTKAPLLRCIPFISKIKNNDVISTGQYMNYQSFSTLQYKKLLKNTFHSIKVELRDALGEKIPFVSVGITRVVLQFRKVSDSHL